MSKQLIDHSPDLKKLRDEGYDIDIEYDYLVVRDVPYLNAEKRVRRGILVSEITTAGAVAAPPRDHVVEFSGETPCDMSGVPLDKIIVGGGRTLGENLAVSHKFSSKAVSGVPYKDYYEKMTAYVIILSSYAHAVDPSATARSFPPIPTAEDESVFKYFDSASSRAGISMVTKKLEMDRIAIVGLGGTGSYVLDLVAKTPVKEIHLFDNDVFLTHNAFRAPGAASLEELNAQPKKVAYLKGIYSNMRRGIVEHAYHIDDAHVGELQGMNFVFMCMDACDEKKLIVESLEFFGVPFVDVGMGVDLVGDSLSGVLRVTASTPAKRDHFRTRVSLTDAGIGDEYDQNIQIADLNSLNAAFAVIRWKKLCGFYLDFQHEHHGTYSIEGNALTSDEMI